MLFNFNSRLSYQISASRVVDLAGQHNYVPLISNWLSTWNERLGTPVNSFIALFAWCSILTLVVPGNSSFEFLASIEQYSVYFFFLLAAIAALVCVLFTKNYMMLILFHYAYSCLIKYLRSADL